MQISWSPMGGALFEEDGTQVWWNGWGSHLYLVWFDHLIPIEHETASGPFMDYQSAKTAARNFLQYV